MNANTKKRSDMRIIVVHGRKSSEATVSFSSAAAVEKALRKSFTNVTLSRLNYELMQSLPTSLPEVVFPVTHGGHGEDGSFQGYLNLLDISYVGSGVSACALAMDKILAKTMFRVAGIPVTPDIVCHRHDNPEEIADRAMDTFGGSCVVKPASEGSAVGISFCETRSQVMEGIIQALKLSHRALIEPCIIGREVTVAVLADPDEPRALPPVEVLLPDGARFDYYHRYTPGASRHVCPALLSAETLARMEKIGVEAHKALGCRHYSRTDMLVQDNGDIVVLELNALPGMSPTSLFPDAARAAGIEFDDLVKRLVELALLSESV